MDEKPLIQQYMQLRSEFMGYLYAMTRDAELAEEIYQNAAVVVIEKADQPEVIRNFRAWAKEVVRRQALHAIRARATAERHGRSMSPELLEAIADVFVHDESDAGVVFDETLALKQCLGGLSKDKRELVALRYERDSSFEQISKQLSSTPTAIQRALSRIRKQLHGCVQKRMQLAEGTP
ncbi:RNA polymerase sigma factor [Stieleria bergensis]|uniref:RNA polymerase sigma factor n=1 Tax=Stieleria bergensis TaxID=2528025 RepID=A0A517SUB5_9BACT|nr:RNA polymerase sigma factor [Planctomycetes bacterium SV_7m_r]